MLDVHFNTKQMLFNKSLKNKIQTYVLLIPKSTLFNEYTKQMQQADNKLYQWKLQRRAVYEVTQKIQHSAVTVTASQSLNWMEWKSTSVAAAKASTQKQSQANWVSEEAIKQHYEKKFCIHYEVSEHFRNNCLYHSAQQLTTSTIIANTTTITASELTTYELDIKKVNDSEKE